MSQEKDSTGPNMPIQGTGHKTVLMPANGLPYQAYSELIHYLQPTLTIHGHNYAPLWPSPPPIPSHLKWTYFIDHLNQSMPENEPFIGIGHSLGGAILLYDAVIHPDRWSHLFIIEPALFEMTIVLLYKFISLFFLDYVLHPMVRATKKRQSTFESKEVIFNRWRNKSTFHYMSDSSLHNFIDSLFISHNGQYKLKFSKAWESEIYRSFCSIDPFIWKNLASIKSNITVIAAETSNSFFKGARKAIKPYCKEFIVIPNTSHMLPFETPNTLANIITHAIKAM